MNVPFIDFSEQYHEIKDEIDVGLRDVFQTGSFILGPREKAFESEFAAYCDSQYCVGLNSGTDALFFALLSLGVGKGDEVILPTHTFIATALCVSYAGAKPVFVDMDEDTYNMSPEAFKKAITPKTKAVIPVHIYGQSADMKEICSIARAKGIKIVEDAAQAHGALYDGKKIGSLGDVACFSFYPTKSLGAFGDGGAVVTNDATIYEKALMYRDYGRQGRYEHKVKGFNSRLDTLQAVILSAKLKRLDKWNKMRGEMGNYYCKVLGSIKEVQAPQIKPDRTHIFQTFVVRVKDRDRILEALKKEGIGVLIHYPIPLHLQEAYKDLGYKRGDFPVAEKVADEILSLPMFPHISKKQIDYVCDKLGKVL